MKGKFNGLALVALFVAVMALTMAIGFQVMPADEPVEMTSTGCDVYMEQGCAKMVVASGGEIEVQSGGTLDIQSGATTDFSGGMDLDGALLDLDADGDTSIQADTDDQIDVEIGGADLVTLKDWGSSTITTDTTENLVEVMDSTPVMTAGTNSLAAVNIDLGIGNSTAGTNAVYGLLIDGITGDAQNTETAIAIGNGWDRGLDMDGNSIYLDNDQDTIIAEASDDVITLTPGAASGSFEVRTGNLQVGDGTPGETHDGEDFYVEGISEFDGAAYFDGAVDMDSTLDVASTLNYGEDDLYPVGFATSGQQMVYGTSVVTGTLAAPHGLTTVTFCAATLGEDPETGAGDAALVTVAVSANVCTLKVWQDDWTTAATETDVVVQWIVVGAP